MQFSRFGCASTPAFGCAQGRVEPTHRAKARDEWGTRLFSVPTHDDETVMGGAPGVYGY
jgi:hypothetical protein